MFRTERLGFLTWLTCSITLSSIVFPSCLVCSYFKFCNVVFIAYPEMPRRGAMHLRPTRTYLLVKLQLNAHRGIHP